MSHAYLQRLMTDAGFAIIGTGGNCTAWSQTLPDGTEICVSDGECSHKLDPRGPVYLGVFVEGSEVAGSADVPLLSVLGLRGTP